MSRHLNQDERNDWLLGLAGDEAVAHCAGCEACRAELEAVQAAVASYREAAGLWSHAAPPRVSVPAGNARWAARPAWSLAAVTVAATVVLAVALPLALRHRADADGAATAAQAQIARDNQLLARINSELESSVPAPLQPLQVNP